MKKALIAFFSVLSILFGLSLFLDVSEFNRHDICLVFTESGGETLEVLPSLKSTLDEALKKCEGTPFIVDSGSIFEMRENRHFYKNEKEGVSPAVKFLSSNHYRFAGITPRSLVIPKERISKELNDAKIAVSTRNASFSNTDGIISAGGVKVYVASYLSDRSFRYLNSGTLKEWGLKPSFVAGQKEGSSVDISSRADISVAIFSEYGEIPFGQDDFSEVMVYFHNSLPLLDIFFTDSKEIDESRNLRKSLVLKSTAKEPSVTIVNYSVIKGGDKESAPVIKRNISTFYVKDAATDKDTAEMTKPFVDAYSSYMDERVDAGYNIKCEKKGSQECLMDRLYSLAVAEAGAECGRTPDFAMTCSVNSEISIAAKESVSRKYVGSFFPENEKSVVVELSWEQIIEIMNNLRLRHECGFLSLNPFRYRYSREGEFIPSRMFRSERRFSVAISLHLFKHMERMQEHEEDICVSAQSPAEILFRDIGVMKVRYFVPEWREESGD